MAVKTARYNFKNPPGITAGIFSLRALPLFLYMITLPCMSQPRVIAENARQKFGTVDKGALVDKYYHIVNAGNEPLVIERVDVECSCTTVEFPHTPLAPGERAVIHVAFNTASAYGRQDRTAIVYSNAPGGPLKLRFKGMVRRK